MAETIDKHKIPFLICSFILVYIVQFVIMPGDDRMHYPGNEETALFLITLIVFIVFVNMFFDIKIVQWVIADIVYILMICIFTKDGAYGVGLSGMLLVTGEMKYSFETAVFDAILIGIVTFIIQLIVRGIRLAILKTKNR